MKAYRSLFLLCCICIFSGAWSQTNDENRIFDDTSLKISEISTNSIHSDFGPSVIHDTLYFTSFNEKANAKSGKKQFYDLFITNISKKEDEKEQRQALREFITRFNDGPVAWCENTRELFVTQNYIDRSVKRKPFDDEIVRLKIIIAGKENGKWIKKGEFPFHNPEYSVGHPAINDAGDTLIFSSDMPGGYGETDLYYSVRKNGEWANPVNMGPKINTAGKEGFPFLTDRHFDGRYLIFSSNQRNSYGNLDLFFTRFPSDFKEIGLFQKPINSDYDDFALTIPANEEYGFMTSNRPGTGDDDIYKFTFKRIVKPEFTKRKTFRELVVIGKKNLQPIPKVQILSCDQELYLSNDSGKVTSFPITDKDCEVTVSAIGYSGISKVIKAVNDEKGEMIRDTIWMNVQINQKIVLRNIYYDFDKWDLLPESTKELDSLVEFLKTNPGHNVRLIAHTDNRGPELYNLHLSQLRAQAAVDYVLSKGIDTSQIKGIGYGETQPVHICLAEVPCTPELHRENRRTEIFIPGILTSEHVKQLIGDYSDGRSDHTPFPTVLEGKPKNFYVVLGSFPDEISAVNFASRLKEKRFRVTVLNDPLYFRVGIPCNSFQEAKDELDDVRSRGMECWIYQSKKN